MSEHNTLAARIELVEKQVRFWKRFSLALAAVSGVTLIVGAGFGPENLNCNSITCRSIYLMGDDEKLQIYIGGFPGKTGVLGGWGISVYGKEANHPGREIWMGVKSDNVPYFFLYGENGETPSVSITRDILGRHRGGEVTTFDEQGNITFLAPNR
jgi:hypothetical protein